MLSGILSLCAYTPVTGSVYDEPSFLRSPVHLSYLSRLLHELADFDFPLEDALLPPMFR